MPSYPCRPAWCIEHKDFAWEYDDGSVSCFHQAIVESGNGFCEVEPMALHYGVNWRWDGQAWRHRKATHKTTEDA